MPADSWSETWAAHFLAYMAGEYGASVNTMQAYDIDLKQYRKALAKPLHVATSDDIRFYISELLNARHLSADLPAEAGCGSELLSLCLRRRRTTAQSCQDTESTQSLQADSPVRSPRKRWIGS